MGIDSANVVLWILNNAIMYFNVSLMQRYIDFVEIQNFRRFLSRKQNLHNNIFVMFLQIYLYQCSTRFPRKMMLVSFKTVAQRVSLVEQELFILQVVYEFTSVFLWDSCCPNLFCIIFCEYLFVFLPLFCYCIFVGNWLRFTASDYPLGIFKLFHVQ